MLIGCWPAYWRTTGASGKTATLPPKTHRRIMRRIDRGARLLGRAHASSDPAEQRCRQADRLRDTVGNLLRPLPAIDLGPIISSIRSPAWSRRPFCLAMTAR
jgi:hypothetical protein